MGNAYHSCGYHCQIPDCIKAQRDELVRMYVGKSAPDPEALALLRKADETLDVVRWFSEPEVVKKLRDDIRDFLRRVGGGA